MSYDTVASLQRMQQLQQAQAASGKRVVLKRVYESDKISALIIVLCILAIPATMCISLLVGLVIYYIREFKRTTYLVKNVATGEKFRVYKQDFKQYKRDFKKKEKQVRRISDL
ncbi:uncharacterized protein KNN_00644 [Bacillus thuringiensis serovar tolworthi]|uniref:Uncharacterized protein n=1 Tax=Bacillus thuringiensis subsp. tolworthi TaxID=1442 RepID=A0A9W3ZRR6_BACTO|nr:MULTISPECIES: hypothetical protein [Bacillus cereus group]MEB8715737.1 hypothetical protein [Bacillus cereus]MRC49511.1 hypothetical protein [Bacillus thuringiensis]MEB9594824.1 hypothetical protein [Bacillus cereus]MRD27784.1 hypothetical protein [Bacillus thuringiensis]BAR81519.1 uncharacterized protein KNN_00644 [Bacillus thuringiensis serovar tolworthi]